MVLFLTSALFFLSVNWAWGFPPEHMIVPIANVTASGEQEPNVAANTLDGDLNTRWSARGDGQWIQYDLAECTRVWAIHIAFHKGDERVAMYDTYIWEGGEWVHWSTSSSSGDTLDLRRFWVEPIETCSIRIVGHGNTVNDWNSITEVIIEGTNIVPMPLAICAVHASDEQDPNVAGNTLDMDLGTRWSAQGRNQWIQFEMCGDDAVIDQISIAWYKGDERSTLFSIERSWDGRAWTQIYAAYSSGTTAELETYKLHPTSALFIRIVGFGNSKNDWNSITEVELNLSEHY